MSLEVTIQAELYFVQVGTFVDDFKVGHVFLLGTVFNHLEGGFGLRNGEACGVLLEDPTLVPGDFLDGVTEHDGMIDSQGADTASGWSLKDIC